ncbi:MAG: DUF86 domain-containing protein [Pseudoflavonifractor sp.]|nr:DUF86 domain-containing protein [Pseudoflavonifractor sp.]
MQSQYSKETVSRILLTLGDIERTISQLREWNVDIRSSDDYYASPVGMQLLAANCTLITAIGEGVNRCNRIAPDFLASNFPDIPWRAIIGMRNHIAHGYFELDADLICEAVKYDIPPLHDVIVKAITLLQS